MSLLSKVKNWFERKLRIEYLKDFISVDSIDIKNIFNIENTHYQIKETKYITLDKIQYIVN